MSGVTELEDRKFFALVLFIYYCIIVLMKYYVSEDIIMISMTISGQYNTTTVSIKILSVNF